jgi:hypothetical protein
VARTSPRLAVLLLSWLAGCRLLSPAIPCELDSNCPDDTACVENTCVEVRPVDDAGAPRPDGGAPESDGGAPNADAGPGEDGGTPGDDAGSQVDAGADSGAPSADAGPDAGAPAGDAGYDAGPVDPGLPGGCVDLASLADAGAPVTHSGDVVAYGDADLAVLADVQRLEGSLTVFSGSYVDLSFPDLLEITGNLVVNNVPDAGPTLAPDFACLQHVGATLQVFGSGWPDPSFPALARVGLDLQLRDGLTSASFPRLGSVRDLSARFTQLTDLTGFPFLTEVRDDLDVRGNGALVSLEGPPFAAVGGGIDIADNPVLAEPGVLLRVASFGKDVNVEDNFVLPSCEVELWRDVFVADGYRDRFEVEGNDDTQTCGQRDPSPCAPTGVALADACDGSQMPVTVTADGTLAAQTTCAGTLTINAGAVDVCAPSLTQVVGDVVVGAAGLQHLRLPALREVTGSVTIDARGLQTLDLRRLRWVTGDLKISGVGEPQVLEVYLPSLQDTAALSISDIASETIFLPAFDTATGALVLSNNPGPLDVFLPDVDDVASLSVVGNAALTEVFGLGALNSAAGAVLIADNPALSTLSGLSDLNSVDSIEIRFNAVLVGLPPDDLVATTSASVHDNPCLDQAAALSWAQSANVGGTATNNGGGGSCP